jgi:hypothetical protein
MKKTLTRVGWSGPLRVSGKTKTGARQKKKKRKRRVVVRLGYALRRKRRNEKENKRKERKRNLESFPKLKILGKKVKGTFMMLIENGFIKDQDSKCKKILNRILNYFVKKRLHLFVIK